MKCTLRSLFLTLLIITLPSCWQHTPESTIVESNDIANVYQYIKPEEYNQNTLVLFDIDNTIATRATDLGSDQWFDAMINQKIKQGLSCRDAVRDVLPLYWQIQVLTWLIPTEKEAFSVIKTLQQKGVTVVALTTRDIYLIYRTLEQLDHLGIDFSKTAPHKPAAPYGTHKPALYLEGVIFASALDKGKVLLHWLDQMNYKPAKIIFVDDKLKNIHSVEQALKQANYPFIGIRYGQFDDRVKNINLEETEREYQLFLQNHPESKPLRITPMPVTS